MTIDEAIKHCLEVAEVNEDIADNCDMDNWMNKASFEECAADHRQLAEWLRELKELKNSIGAMKLSNMKEALALIRTLKAELNGWKEDPFDIIAEVCGAVTDCRLCQWYEKCPFPKNYGSYPEEWRGLYMTFGERIHKMRTEKGMTQDELATAVGYKSRSTIAKIEAGKRDAPQSMIVAFAKALGTTPAYLMGWEDNKWYVRNGKLKTGFWQGKDIEEEAKQNDMLANAQNNTKYTPVFNINDVNGFSCDTDEKVLSEIDGYEKAMVSGCTDIMYDCLMRQEPFT